MSCGDKNVSSIATDRIAERRQQLGDTIDAHGFPCGKKHTLTLDYNGDVVGAMTAPLEASPPGGEGNARGDTLDEKPAGATNLTRKIER